MGSPGGSEVKHLPAIVGDVGSIPGLGRSPREGNSNPLQYSCLGNPMDRGAWWVTVHGVTKSWTEQLHNRYFSDSQFCLINTQFKDNVTGTTCTVSEDALSSAFIRVASRCCEATSYTQAARGSAYNSNLAVATWRKSQ